jgi:hypothetical protein
MSAVQSREWAIPFLVALLGLSLLLCRYLAARTPRPAILWVAGAYWSLLHLIYLYGLLTPDRFAGALAPLTLCTFPMSLGEGVFPQGFVTLADLAANYVRYVVCFGGMNTLLLAGLLALILPGAGSPGRVSPHYEPPNPVLRDHAGSPAEPDHG